MGDADEEPPAPKRKVFIQAVSGYIGGNLAKRFAAEGFEVLGTLKAPSDPKPLAVTTVVEPTPEGLATAFRASELTVLDCLGDFEAAEAVLVAASLVEPIESPKVLVGVSSVMTWARTSTNPDEPETPVTEAEYKRRRPHSNYKELVALEKLVTKSQREGLRTHVVAAGLTYGAEEDVFHPLFKSAWGCQPLPLLTMSDGSNVRARRRVMRARRAHARAPSSSAPWPLGRLAVCTRCRPAPRVERPPCTRARALTCIARSLVRIVARAAAADDPRR